MPPKPPQKKPATQSTPSRKSTPRSQAEESDIGTFILAYSPPGYGKTTLAAEFPKPIFFTTHDEQGIRVLQKSGTVDPAIPVVMLDPLWSGQLYPKMHDHPAWIRLMNGLDDILNSGGIEVRGKHYNDRRTIVVDTISALQSVCWQHTTSLEYNGDGSAGSDFYSFQKGYEIAATRYWQEDFLNRCLALVEKGYNVVLLCHATATTVPNPTGPDYQEWRPTLQAAKAASNILALTTRCVHNILFLYNSHEFGKANETQKKSRNIVKNFTRMVGCTTSTWFMAKNWLGLREDIPAGDTPAATFAAITSVVPIK